MGIGSKHLVRVKAGKDHSMDVEDLRARMTEVIENGGIPVYVVATTGATDQFGIDDVQAIKEVTTTLEKKYNLQPVHIHADSALGGFMPSLMIMILIKPTPIRVRGFTGISTNP